MDHGTRGACLLVVLIHQSCDDNINIIVQYNQDDNIDSRQSNEKRREVNEYSQSRSQE